MSKCFVMTGGGTGAKVAEALVHLCAAGGGPDEVHLLLVDADTDNGNVKRTNKTVNVYQRLQPWGWKLNGTRPMEFFKTRIYAYYLKEEVKNVLGGTLGQAAGRDHALKEVLDLLYDEDEQTSENHVGFLARANLGCLILAEHLEHYLREGDSQAGRFLRALSSAMQGNAPVQVAVAGSIFGGTGASLLPVARTCILNALGLKNSDAAVGQLHFAAVMMLPYFAPRTKLKSVDPERFLLDSTLALQYYGRNQLRNAEGFERIYLVGSDEPGRKSNQLNKPVSGGENQTNPAFLEEWIGALAIQHFAIHGATRPSSDERVYLYQQTQAGIAWENLPWAEPTKRAEAIDRMACFLHLAAFYLRPQRKTGGGLTAGLRTTLHDLSGSQLEYFGWFDKLLHEWASKSCVEYTNVLRHSPNERWQVLLDGAGTRSISHLQGELGEYFARILCWASTALGSDGINLVAAPGSGDAEEDYARLYSAMCDLDGKALQQDGPADDFRDDNALARLVRASATAMVMERQSHAYTGKPGGSRLALRRKVNAADGPVVPWIRREEIKEAAGQLQRAEAYDAYYGETAP